MEDEGAAPREIEENRLPPHEPLGVICWQTSARPPPPRALSEIKLQALRGSSGGFVPGALAGFMPRAALTASG